MTRSAALAALAALADEPVNLLDDPPSSSLHLWTAATIRREVTYSAVAS